MSKRSSYLSTSQSMTSLNDMGDSRIITKNLVYVIGLSHSFASHDKLMSYEYFGQYGHIAKLVVNKKKAYNINSPNGPSYSAYVTYSYPHEASIAILALDNTVIDNNLIRASFGTTKYCSFFLKRIECTNKECLFLHRKACESDIIKREDLNVNKSIFYEQQLYAIKLANLYSPDVRKAIFNSVKNKKTVFPSPTVIYKNSIVIENDPVNKESQTKMKKCYREDLNSKALRADAEAKEISKEDMKSNTRNKQDSQLGESKDEITCTSTGDEKKSMNKAGVKLFISKERSRFEFANDKEQYSSIPQFVLDLVNKKYQMDMLGNSFTNKDNLLLLNPNFHKEVKHNNPWAEFILSSKTTKSNTHSNNVLHNRKDDDLILDFENINQFIFKQTSCK